MSYSFLHCFASFFFYFLFFCLLLSFFFFFFNDTATTEIYTLSLHDALPISTFFFQTRFNVSARKSIQSIVKRCKYCYLRSEEHTSQLQSQSNLVCRLLLEKKTRPCPPPPDPPPSRAPLRPARPRPRRPPPPP